MQDQLLNNQKYKIYLLSDKQIEQQFFHIETQDQLLSPHLGSISEDQKCLSCGQYFPNCNGHVGYIKSFYYYNPMLQPLVVKILRHTCTNCLFYDPNLNTTGNFCRNCQKKVQYFNVILLFDKVFGYVEINKDQAINILKLLDIETSNRVSYVNAINSLHPLLVQKILEYQLLHQPNEIKQLCLPETLLNVVHKYIPVVSYQFRVSQPEIGLINNMNIVYQKLFPQQYVLQEFENQQKNQYFMTFTDRHQNIVLNKYFITVYLLMSAYNTPQLEEQLLLQNKNVNISLLQQATPKQGLFRGEMNSVRVNKSSRTVITGNPYLNCDTLVCPQYIAETITVCVTVNNQNYNSIIKLINNFPNYPCVKYIVSQANTQTEIVYHKITTKNKEIMQTVLLPGDYVFRQVLEGDCCLTNRYPSLAEESFGCHKVIIKPIKSIQFSMSVVGKMNADFDGDEMQLFFYPSSRSNTEQIALQSISRQFISYETGKNIIGGAKDLKVGMFNIQENFKEQVLVQYTIGDKRYNGLVGSSRLAQASPFEQPISGFTQVGSSKWLGKMVSQEGSARASAATKDSKNPTYEQVFNDLIPKGLTNYDDGSIEIKDNKFVKVSADLASNNSKFLTHISTFYGSQTALKFIDYVLKYCYQINELAGSTLYPNIFDIPDGINKQITLITKKQRELQLNLIEKFYTNNFHSPQGVDPKDYFEKYIITSQSYDQFIQLQMLLESLKVVDQNYKSKTQYYNKVLEKSFSDQMNSCCIYVGQKKNFNDTRITNPIRVFSCFRKFDFKPETQGFIFSSFAKGITATESYYECIESRKPIYMKTNATPDVGYLARRLSKGLDMTYVSYDGIVRNTDGVLSFNYGPGNYDPRFYAKVSLSKIFKLDDKQLKDLYHDQFIIDLVNDLKHLNERTRYHPDQKNDPILQIPFEIQQYDYIKKEDIKKVLGFNITSKQSTILQEAIYQRNLNMYIYLLLFKNENSKQSIKNNIIQDITELMKKSQCSPGESVGTKAGLTLSRPITQLALSSIHSKKKNGIQIVNLDELGPSDRLKSLIDHVQAPIIFCCEVFKGSFTAEDFVKKYHSYNFKDLDPKYNYYLLNEVYNLEITLQIAKLSYYNVDFEQLIRLIPLQYKSINIELQNNNKQVVIQMTFQQDVIDDVKQLRKQFIVGTGYFKNLYSENNRIYGNVDNPVLLYQIPEINPDSIYVSEPDIDCFGLFYKKQSVYNELCKSLEASDELNILNKTHIYLMAQQLTYLGFYGSFGRNTYKKDNSRSLIQNVIYEEAQYFITDQLLNDVYNDTKDFVSAQLFGTQCQQGVNVSKIFMDV